MRKRQIIGRAAPAPEAKPSAGLAGRLGDTLRRRREGKLEHQVQALGSIMDGGVVALPKEATPLSDILRGARHLSRPARSTDYLHVSDLVSKCLRRIALMDRLKIPAKAQSLSLTDSLTFSQGDAIHDVIRLRAAQGNARMVWGNWSCKCGSTCTPSPRLFGDVDQGESCPACKGSMDVYTEVPMFDEEYKIVGNPDLILYLPDPGALHVTELKSIAHDSWKDLARPQPDHVIQVLFYWFLMQRQGYRMTDTASILYVTKGWMFSGEPYKEFTFNAQAQLHRLDPYLEDALAVGTSRSGGNLPPRICARDDAPIAKKCDVCKTCFGISDDEAPVNISIASALSTPVAKPRSRR